MATPLLDKVFAAGGTGALFSLLKDWPKADLEQLLKDLDAFFEDAQKKLEEGRKVEMFKPENFFSNRLSQRMNSQFDAAGFEVAGICGEIASVALFYLGDTGEGK
jgi:hypothetical protein